MIIQAEMHAYANGAIREIDIPDDRAANATNDDLLELAFYFGQNDFQPRPFPSLSVGDVVVLPDGSKHRVEGCGWSQVPT